MTGVIIGIYIACIALFVMEYFLLDSIKCKLTRIERYLEKISKAAEEEGE